MTQRKLADKVGISVSSINYCLNALVEKGWLKIGNFGKNPDKLSYAYLLTPTGMKEKMALTKRFLHRKMAEYEMLQAEFEELRIKPEPQTAASDGKVAKPVDLAHLHLKIRKQESSV